MITEKEFESKSLNNKIKGEIMQNKYKNDYEVRIAVLETTVSHIYQALGRMEKNIEKGFEAVDKRFQIMDEKFDKKFDSISKRLDMLDCRVWTVFLWILGTIGAFSILFTGALAKGFHWLGF